MDRPRFVFEPRNSESANPWSRAEAIVANPNRGNKSDLHLSFAIHRKDTLQSAF
jgi:hypothetical protein